MMDKIDRNVRDPRHAPDAHEKAARPVGAGGSLLAQRDRITYIAGFPHRVISPAWHAALSAFHLAIAAS